MSLISKQPVLPLLLAHRGYAARFPENTLTAIDAAVADGAKFVEIDVQLSRDGVPHLLHDEDFARTGNRPERIFDLNAAEIANISVGEPARFGKRFSDARAPRLLDVAEALSGWPDVTLFVEFKRQSLEHFGVNAVLDAALQALAEVLQQCVFISFELPVIEEARRLTGRPIGWALRSWDEASKQHADTIAPDYLFCNIERLPAAPADLWQGSWKWVVYEIKDSAVALELAARGVDIIETMAFAEMHAALSEAS